MSLCSGCIPVRVAQIGAAFVCWFVQLCCASILCSHTRVRLHCSSPSCASPAEVELSRRLVLDLVPALPLAPEDVISRCVPSISMVIIIVFFPCT
jgi:hypothetical protein